MKDKLVPPKVDENERLTEYFSSKTFFRKFPGRPNYKPHPTVKSQLVKSKRTLKCSEQNLSKLRIEAKMKGKKITEQYNKLIDMEEKFKSCFLTFEKFIVENHDKRHRARKMIEDSRILYEKRCKDIDILNLKMFHLHYIKWRREAIINKYKIYEMYLEGTCQLGGFKSINEVMQHYEVLHEVKHDIMLQHESRANQMYEISAEFANSIYFRRIKLDEYTFQANMLEKRYDTARRRTLLWEGVLNGIRTASIKIMSESSMITKQIDKMYNQMALRASKTPYSKVYKAPSTVLTVERKLFLIDRYFAAIPSIENKIKKIRQ